MANLAIKADKISKKYRIGGKDEYNNSFGEAIISLSTYPYRRLKALARYQSAWESKKEIWALDKVSFECNHGDVVGVIGRNGSGKTTLLKILSGITEPTHGYADLYGRTGALLEVGTGFHTDLTGRENIFLSGAIMGMRRREVQEKFDRIVDFSGIDQFIDTPVKFYSSGMYLRLAFAVAAHLEPEILLVDEVLAVGDAEFQEKCLGKMGDLTSKGRAVLFVSHNLAAVERLCKKGIVLDHGKIVAQGSIKEAIMAYLALIKNEREDSEDKDESFRTIRITNIDLNGNADNSLRSDKSFYVSFSLIVKKPLININLNLTIRNSLEQIVFYSGLPGKSSADLSQPGNYRVTIFVPVIWLIPAQYGIQIKAIGEVMGKAKERSLSDPLIMNVINPKLEKLSSPGMIVPDCDWKVTGT